MEEAVQRTCRESLIIAGFMTHYCVSSTACATRDLGYGVTIVGGATATRDLPDGKGGIVPASVLQTASLAALADRIAVVVAAAGEIPD
jgi:nicotinamidase-related amidase